MCSDCGWSLAELPVVSVSTDLLVCSLCRHDRQSRGVEELRDRRPCRFVKVGVQRGGCQDGCPQPVLGYGSFLSFARCPLLERWIWCSDR